jgi:hypothetical protein
MSQSYLYRIEAMVENGDFIFQDLDCGPACQAIEAVTEGYDGYDFSHVGIVKKHGDSILVGESIGKGVQWTPLKDFIARCTYIDNTPQLLIMRLKAPADSLIPKALAFIDDQVGVAYDPFYTYGDSLYYCSELLYDAFGQNKNELFTLTPMTFKKPKGDEFADVWIEYFKELEHPIPEGEAGINPGSMSRSPYLKPIFLSGLEKKEH